MARAIRNGRPEAICRFTPGSHMVCILHESWSREFALRPFRVVEVTFIPDGYVAAMQRVGYMEYSIRSTDLATASLYPVSENLIKAGEEEAFMMTIQLANEYKYTQLVKDRCILYIKDYYRYWQIKFLAHVIPKSGKPTKHWIVSLAMLFMFDFNTWNIFHLEYTHHKKFEVLSKRNLSNRFDLYYSNVSDPNYCMRAEYFSNALLVLGFRCTMCKSLAGCQEFCSDVQCNGKRSFNKVAGKEDKGFDYYRQNQHEIKQRRDLPSGDANGGFGEC
jgi:hypothetical protein